MLFITKFNSLSSENEDKNQKETTNIILEI